MRLKTVLAFLLSCLLLAGCAPGVAVEKPKPNVSLGQYKTTPSIEKIKTKAEDGDPYFQALLGQALRKGEGVKTNYAEALIWLEKSAAQNHPLALFHLARMYDYGEGVKKDEYKAKELSSQSFPGLKKLAKSGNVHAQTSLGQMYLNGDGVPKDSALAVMWYRKAADQGYAKAQVRLGQMYLNTSIGVPDYALAVMWFRKAADQGNALGQWILGGRYEHGEGVPKDYALAVQWHQRSADQGCVYAQTRLGDMYSDGKGVPKDETLAMMWFRKAADQGNAYGQIRLGEMYSDGKGDYAEAVKWYQKAAGGVYVLNKLKKLDPKVGLLLHMKLKWADINNFKENPVAKALVAKGIKGYKAGMDSMGKDILRQAIATHSLTLYMNNDWYHFYINKAPLSITSELLLAVKPHKQDRLDFWFDYAHNANLAGQPLLALAGVKKMQELAGREQDANRARILKNAAALLTANAYMQMGRAKDAYKVLLANGEWRKNDFYLINYINHWARPLLKDKEKLSFLIGIEKKELTGKYSLPKTQPFHDMETGKLVKSAPRGQQKKMPEKQTPAVEILD